MTMERQIKDGLSLVLIFAAAVVGESPLCAAGLVAAADRQDRGVAAA